MRIANAGTICREAVCGAGFTDAVIRSFFGFHPSLNLASQNPLWKPKVPHGFSGKLRHVRWGNRLLTITSQGNGLSVIVE